MRVHILKGNGRGLYGFTPDPSGTNLPAGKGPWQAFKSIEIFEEHPVPRIGVYEADVLAGIKRDGYYLMDEQAIESELFERR
jgi:hypothetical protein